MKIQWITALVALLPLACAPSQEGPRFSWEVSNIHGERTGVQHLTARLTQAEAFGSWENGVYTAPNGSVFQDNAVAGAARILIEAQPAVSAKKKVIATVAENMLLEEPQSALSNMYIDALMQRVADLSGRKVDVGITNFGGVRMNFEQGDMMVEDVESMFPFENTLYYLPVSGEGLLQILGQLAAAKWEIVGGVRCVVRDGQLVSAQVGGQEIDPAKTYGLATISFLLTNGDGLTLKDFALKDGQGQPILVDTGERIDSCMLHYIRQRAGRGELIRYQTDDRITIQ